MGHAYKDLSAEEKNEILSNYLIDSWSYSKISDFSRNEKAFEMVHVYGQRIKSAPSSVAGSAYHYALDVYFTGLKNNSEVDLSFLEMAAFEYIERFPANQWKLQKTTPTVEESQKSAITTVSKLLKNFFSERSVYTWNLKEILFVEESFEEYLTVNGVDIPLPCRAKVDLIIKTNADKIVIIDHKSKSGFSTKEELALSIGRQAITYVKCFEQKYGIPVDEVWFIENKYSTNKNGEAQLSAFKIELDENIRKLYESLLYEPLKRTLEATSNPDYVYVINDSDNFVEKAEVYDFWAKTMIAEVEEFNVLPSKKEMIEKRLKKIRDASLVSANPKIIKEFRKNAGEFIQYDLSNKNMTQSEKIEHVLRSFGIITRVAHVFDGYSSNTFLLEVSAGVKISSIHSHRLDLANVLDASSVRMPKELVVYEGRSYVAIETPKKRDKDLIFDPAKLEKYKIPMGMDNFGRLVVWDLDNHSTPHALICGATGSGKSVCIKSTIEYAKLAGVDHIHILDPKHEFKGYDSDKITVLNSIDAIEDRMEILVAEMNIRVEKGISKKTLIVFDEFADAVAASRKGNDLNVYEMAVVGYSTKGVPKMKRQLVDTEKSLEENLRILLQKGRSVGFRIISATQRASVKVITGDAKVNFPVQICFRVPKEVDSKVVLDEAGAESLGGMGDGLIRSPEYADIVRFQAFYKPNN